MSEIDPPYLYAEYRSSAKRAPSRVLLPLPEELRRVLDALGISASGGPRPPRTSG